MQRALRTQTCKVFDRSSGHASASHACILWLGSRQTTWTNLRMRVRQASYLIYTVILRLRSHAYTQMGIFRTPAHGARDIRIHQNTGDELFQTRPDECGVMLVSELLHASYCVSNHSSCRFGLAHRCKSRDNLGTMNVQFSHHGKASNISCFRACLADMSVSLQALWMQVPRAKGRES
jgi:hypothetical protein